MIAKLTRDDVINKAVADYVAQEVMERQYQEMINQKISELTAELTDSINKNIYKLVYRGEVCKYEYLKFVELVAEQLRVIDKKRRGGGE